MTLGAGFSRRRFLQLAATVGFGSVALPRELLAGYEMLAPLAVANPLAHYPNRDWEQQYRDVYRTDGSFHFLCAPNDTHNCLLRAYTKNGVVVRIEPSWGYGKARDLDGNVASQRWDPRGCQKGFALARRVYGDRRIDGARVRRGFQQWVESGCPRGADGRPPAELFRRGDDVWEKVPFEKAFDLHARALADIAATYSGEGGATRLRTQGYDPAMIEAMEGAGTRTLKHRGGMPLLGPFRIYALTRLANALALLDAKVRGVGPDEAKGATAWDSYSWHTDLPPGHPMVTGEQTVEFDLFSAERSKLLIVWGMNWITTKMPDAHWLTEARQRGTKVVVIACEYSATANKGDEVIVVRPGTTPALALGLAHVILREKRWNDAFVRGHTDLPLLVRMDTLETLRASDLPGAGAPAALSNYVRVLADGEKPPASHLHDAQQLPRALREEWGDFVVWDAKAKKPVAISRDDVGARLAQRGVEPALEGRFEVELASGARVQVQPVFELVRRYVLDNFDPKTVSEITWAPEQAIVSLAREIAANPEHVLFALGMGPNQFFNNDLKDRTVFLLAALSRNVGFLGGNVGSYAGNYKLTLFGGVPKWAVEDPFELELDPAATPHTRYAVRFESAHYFNYGDAPLREGNRLFTGKGHVPVPSKALFLSNSNSILGNTKWHYDVVHNTLPKVECVAFADWWWTGSCEYADVVYGVDSWAETKVPDITASCTNPFLQVFPRTPLARLFDTRADVEVVAGVAKALGERIGDRRFADAWKFVHEGKPEVYLQRILDHSACARGYRIEELEQSCADGTPALMMTRTYPRATGWEQSHEDKPWYTRSGRLELYRPEPEWIESGENLPVYREPVDSTFYEPNVLVARPHPAIRPIAPDGFGIPDADRRAPVRQVRHVVRPWKEVAKTQHPLAAQGHRFVYHTPKFRHGVHTTPADTDVVAVFLGPFGDIHRRDKRMPFVTEGYVDINPADARELGIADGDYVWIQGDPAEKPFRGWQNDPAFAEVAKLVLRARYYPGTPRGVLRTFHNMYGSTIGSVRGAKTRPDGLAKSPTTGYQSMYRTGSHQSATRAWLKPTLMTDTLARRASFGQTIGKGFAADIHCPTGAPREAFVRIEKVEDGGMDGRGVWRPAALGFRPTNENDAMQRYLAGAFAEAASDGDEEA
ncbi:MAG: molybdopterin oxidoreductase [Proteobacteria bacterium]|nr:MAG: molybdopterin oxidoreductase [Pseudomonadota bacterium]